MKRIPKSYARRRSVPRPAPSALESQARAAMRSFVRVLARCGCAPRDLEQQLVRACREIPESWLHRVDARDPGAPGHVLTLWFSDPAYLDALGNPKPLPLRGRSSIETLAHRVDPGLEAREVLHYLVQGRGLRRTGRRYVPRDRVLNFRGAERMDRLARLRGLFGLLSTMEHNSQSVGKVPGRFDVFAWNPHFPVSARAGFDKRLRRFGNRFLVQIDADMHVREHARKKGERTIPFGVGVYRFEQGPTPARGRRRRTRK
jgi:hypothetical protein